MIGRDEVAWEREGLVGWSEGWALGSAAWRKAVAMEHAHMVLDPSLPRGEVAELRKAAWNAGLVRVLPSMRRKPKALETRPLKQDCKVPAARQVRLESGAPIPWLATTLKLGRPASVRNRLSRAQG